MVCSFDSFMEGKDQTIAYLRIGVQKMPRYFLKPRRPTVRVELK